MGCRMLDSLWFWFWSWHSRHFRTCSYQAFQRIPTSQQHVFWSIKVTQALSIVSKITWPRGEKRMPGTRFSVINIFRELVCIHSKIILYHCFNFYKSRTAWNPKLLESLQFTCITKVPKISAKGFCRKNRILHFPCFCLHNKRSSVIGSIWYIKL